MEPRHKRPDWDKLYASYFWKINLDPNNPNNWQEYLIGYSKRKNQNEAEDKDELLKTKIVNLYNNGYFSKFLSWEIYMRTGAVIDKSRDPKILILYPRHYDIPPLNHDAVYKKFGRWLDELYAAIKNNHDVRKLLKSNKKPISKDDYLNPQKVSGKIPDIATLYRYSGRLSEWGHAPGAIEKFIADFKEMKGWNEPQPVMNSLLATFLNEKEIKTFRK